MVLAHDISKGDRTKDVKITQNITFETMLLAPNTLKGLKESGFNKPSPIQLYGIPIGKCGFDLLLEAKSGTGKTAVFTIIALEKLDICKGLQVVILTPTREIAAQICDVIKQIGCMYKDLHIEVVMGGLPLQDDIEKFKKPVHIVVGSPGRLKHLIRNKCIDVKSVRLFVLDEADKLMEEGFQSDIKFIHTSLPKEKQVIMSSATYPESSKNLINTYVQNASHVCPDSDCVLLGIEQKVSLVKYNSNIIRYTQGKFKEMHKILGRLQFKQCLVFCNYQVRVAEVHEKLKKAEWPSEKLYGQQEQVDRLEALVTLQQYKCRILVSTDLAARGIDASNIDLVINFEPPHDWQTYLHRIGRAGRFGSHGLAVTILSEGKEEKAFKEILKSMELPIHMRHLWSNEEFHIGDDTAPLKPTPSLSPNHCNLPLNNTTSADINQKVSCKEIWELLSSTSTAKNSIETFESLCKLSENSDSPKIEQFSDLMLSLEKNSQETEEHVVYKTIEIGKLSSKQSVTSQNSIKEKDTVINGLKESNGNKSNIFDFDENKNELNATSSDEYKNIHDDVNNTTINKINVQNDTSKTMLNLDLPIAFSSSKFKKHNTKRKINKTINQDITNHKPSQLHQNAAIQETNGDINYDDAYIEKEIDCRNQSNVNNYNGRVNNYLEKELKCNIPQKHKCNRSLNRKFTSESCIGQKESGMLYNNWYMQLKMRMKYIEQAIYIEEISNQNK